MNAAKALVKVVLISMVNNWARMAGFSFPAKYTWRWKAEMLLNRYERDTTVLFKNIVRPGMTVFDVGGHIGYFTRLFSRLAGPGGKVFAFEPDPANFALLQRNTEKLSNVTLINAAVSDSIGTIDFYEIEDSTGCHTTVPTSAPARKLSVRSLMLDKFMEEHGEPDVIKMDIEGGEPSAVKGMEKLLGSGRPLAIVMELQPEALARSGTTSAEVIASLEKKGFVAYGILRGGLRSGPIHDIEGLKLYEGKTDYANVLFERAA